MTIKVSDNIQDLIGQGEEWLVSKYDSQLILCKFYDGMMMRSYGTSNQASLKLQEVTHVGN